MSWRCPSCGRLLCGCPRAPIETDEHVGLIEAVMRARRTIETLELFADDYADRHGFGALRRRARAARDDDTERGA